MSTSSWLEGRRKNMREIWNKKDAIYNELIRQGKFKIIDMCLCSLNCKVLVNANYARIQSHQYSNLEFNFTSWDVNQRGIHNKYERNPSPRQDISARNFMRSALYQRGALLFDEERGVGGIPHQLTNFREISFALQKGLTFWRRSKEFWKDQQKSWLSANKAVDAVASRIQTLDERVETKF